MPVSVPLNRKLVGTSWPTIAGLLLGVGAVAFTLNVSAQTEDSDSSVSSLKQMSLEQLTGLKVTSVSKTPESLSDAAASIYVITHEDIIRSGATSIPEILRLAPNLHVVQISPSNYTITARGFDGNSADQSFSDKLLVLIDGRSVYSPLYSGVYWDAQDLDLDDIDRIEVISGPGATLWGANAVNGVINIITRKSSDTEGVELDASGGNLEKDATAQVGAGIGDSGSYRVYAKGFEREAFDTPSGSSADDSWWKTQTGFRTDWNPAGNSIDVQGDMYRANESQPQGEDLALAGANLLTRWVHPFTDTSGIQAQAYFDQTQRFTIDSGAFVLNTYDLELQDSFTLGGHNSIVWGAGDRVSRYDITNTSTLLFVPDRATLNLTNAFAQDSIILIPDLKLILGVKFENDPYSGTTPLPNARISWNLNQGGLIWSAVSQAIRAATPFDRDVEEYLGGILFLTGGPQFKPEKLTAYELGYRNQVASTVSFSISTFYNDYNDLRSLEFSPTVFPLQWGNLLAGTTYGMEGWGTYQPRDWWRLSFGLDELREDLHFQPGSSKLLGVAQAGDDPHYQAFLRAAVNLPRNLTLDGNFRYVGYLPDPYVPGYDELNVRLGWAINQHLDTALSGFNLLHAHHVEFTTPPSDEISRSVLLSVRLKL
jgi:iron complex outermembrane recepter protein